MHLKPVRSNSAPKLKDKDAAPPKRALRGDALADANERESERISDLQKVLYADSQYALLVVLQGRDASGKDGTIRHVFKSVNPQGCQVAAFRAPSEEEGLHDFLWRIHARVPARGMIGVFNRSHYEDVLVPRVRGALSQRMCRARYDQINDFERMLSENGVVILKFFLHVSRDEQRRRLQERLDDETKNWKFRVGDLDDRAHWKQYTSAYRDMLMRCSTKWAPWYVVPADHEKLRNYLIARCIADALEALDLRYPPGEPAVRNIKVE